MEAAAPALRRSARGSQSAGVAALADPQWLASPTATPSSRPTTKRIPLPRQFSLGVGCSVSGDRRTLSERSGVGQQALCSSEVGVSSGRVGSGRGGIGMGGTTVAGEVERSARCVEMREGLLSGVAPDTTRWHQVAPVDTCNALLLLLLKTLQGQQGKGVSLGALRCRGLLGRLALRRWAPRQDFTVQACREHPELRGRGAGCFGTRRARGDA